MDPPGSSASLDRWLGWLETLSPREIELGLDRIAIVLARLSLPRPERILTVGGTNGKGSSVAMLDALLREGGVATGAYTSPHVLHYCERIRLSGVPASEQQVLSAFSEVEAARQGVLLTYFEFGTLAALCVFAQAGVDAAILEVGLGGRLDAVNVVDHDGCLITNISLDHCDWLGDSIESIALEKAGIMRRDKVVVFGNESRPEAIDVRARETGARLIAAGRDFSYSRNGDGHWNWRGMRHELQGLAAPHMTGIHQLQNAAGVLALVEGLGYSHYLVRESINAAFAAARLPGRLQALAARGRRWLLDGAHNPAGAEALARALPRNADLSLVGVVGILGDKDAAGIIRALADRIQRFIAVPVDSPRTIPAEQLGLQVSAVTDKACRVESTLAAGLEAAIRATDDGDTIVVAGSFFTVAAALEQLGK